MTATTSRRRSRATGQDSAPRQSTSNNKGFLRRGRQGMDRSREEQHEAAKRREKAQKGLGFINRFRMTPGEEAEIIILDDNLDDIVHLHEHSIPGPGNDWKAVEHVVCPKDWDNCPVCDKAQGAGKDSRFKPSYYMFALTVVDTRGYTNRDGKTIPHTKKLYCVKSSMHEQFYKLFQVAMNKHGSLRGMSIILTRDGNRDPNTGAPTIDDEGQMFAMISEDELAERFGHDAIKNDQGEVVRPADFDITAFPYEEVFEEPDVAELRKRFGGYAPAGSPEAMEDEWGDEEGGSDTPAAPARSQRARRTRSAPTTDNATDNGTDEGDQGDEGEEAPAAEAPRRSRTRGRTRSAQASEGALDGDNAPL